MKRIVLPITTFAVGFLIAFIVFKLSYKHDADTNIPVESKTEEQIFQNYIDNLPPQKREVIENITPQDIHFLGKVRKEKEIQVISDGDDIWANGSFVQDRFDDSVAETFTGEYKGVFTFTNTNKNKKETFNISINFKGTKTSDNNTMVIFNKNVTYSFSFTSKDLGIDENNVQLIFTWNNNAVDPLWYISHFAFKVPMLQVLQSGKYILYGLNVEYEWQNIGEIELKRIK